MIVVAVVLGSFLSNQKPNPAKKEAYETEIHNTPQQADNSSSIFVDIASRKINIPDGYISSIYKDTYIDKEQVQTPERITKIISDINDAEIAALSIDSEKILEIEPMQNISQYPLRLETNCKSDFLKVGLLAQNQEDYLVQLSFVVPSENIEHTDEADIPPCGGRR